MPILTVIAGPNGSGKSTLTRSLDFPGKENLLDPDAIAASMASNDPHGAALAAGRLVLERRKECLASGVDFAIETTLAGNGVLSLMREAKARGFDVTLLYVCLDDSERNVRRVSERVAAGGHFVPPEDVRRRYDRSLANAAAAAFSADSSIFFDNSEHGHVRVLEVKAGIVTWTAPDLPDWARRVLSGPGLAQPAC